MSNFSSINNEITKTRKDPIEELNQYGTKKLPKQDKLSENPTILSEYTDIEDVEEESFSTSSEESLNISSTHSLNGPKIIPKQRFNMWMFTADKQI